MQISSWLGTIAIVVFIISTALRSSHIIDSLIYHTSIPHSELFSIALSWVGIAFMIIYFFENLLYYIKNDKTTFMTRWYLDKQSTFLKYANYEAAYDCLQKANQLSPDSVFVWCVIAAFNEWFFKKPDESDRCLAKAKQILDASASPSPKDQAVFEHYSGYILECRDQLQDAIGHFKKAYELDPTRYRKKVYEDALEALNTTPPDSDEPKEVL
jgi:tetratricopeptide (TPR) repeat protein